MQLSSLIDEYRTCEKALYTAIRTERIAAIREYDIRMNWLRNVIRDYDAPTLDERLQQIGFFMDSISQASDLDPDSTLFNDVQAVMQRYMTEPSETETAADNETLAGVSGPQLIRDPRLRDDAVAMIEKTDMRISAFDRDFRYTYASPANSRFYDLPQETFPGRHISEIIGNKRYEKRARLYFDKCLGGQDQCYYYYLDSEESGRQLLECRMLRQHDSDNDALGALIVMRDLTAGFADPIKSAEENRV